MAEEYGLYIDDYEGFMPIVPGPYKPIILDRSIPDLDDVEIDPIDYESSLGVVMKAEGLELMDDIALQSLYQHARQLRSIEASFHMFSITGEAGAAAVTTYWKVLDSIKDIVDFEQRPDFAVVFMQLVDKAIEDEESESLLDEEEREDAEV